MVISLLPWNHPLYSSYSQLCKNRCSPSLCNKSQKNLWKSWCFYQAPRALSTSLAIKWEAALPKWFVGVFVGVFFHSDKLPNNLKKTVSASFCCYMLQSFHILWNMFFGEMVQGIVSILYFKSKRYSMENTWSELA